MFNEGCGELSVELCTVYADIDVLGRSAFSVLDLRAFTLEPVLCNYN